MIDLHTHFLPGIDDGAKNADIAAKMLRDSYEQGVSHCVATPHCTIHKNEDIFEFLAGRDKSFSLLKGSGELDAVPALHFGAELYLDNNVRAFKEIDKLCISGTNYLLVEFERTQIKADAAEWIYNLTMAGINPVLAHVERYDLERLKEIGIFELDIVFQINSSNFLSIHGRRKVKKLLEFNKFFVVSSDMHNLDTRPCNMRKAYDIAKKKFSGKAEALFVKNAEKILF